MPDFSKRSDTKELLDDPAIPFEDIKKNMQELNTINTLLGGHRITLKGFKKLLGNAREISVCEIGCGGGDNLFAIKKWCDKNNVKVHLTGIDINSNCIEFAKQQYPNFDFICSDYRGVKFGDSLTNHGFLGESPERDSPQTVQETANLLRENHLKKQLKPDIIFNSLLCHHFADNEIIEMINWMKYSAAKGFFINDLHRHPFAYYSIKYITKLFSKSYLVKNDAPLSVLRGFTLGEWKKILERCGINAKAIWEWAFRHLIVAQKGTSF